MQLKSAMRPFILALGLLLVASVHVAVGFLLYRNRVVNKSELGDEIVLYLPWIAATVAYGVLFWRSGYFASKLRIRWGMTVAVALVAGFISFLEMLTICANRFGT